MNGKIKQKRALVFIIYVEDDTMPRLNKAVIESFEHHIQELNTNEFENIKHANFIGKKGKRQVSPTTSYQWRSLNRNEENSKIEPMTLTNFNFLGELEICENRVRRSIEAVLQDIEKNKP